MKKKTSLIFGILTLLFYSNFFVNLATAEEKFIPYKVRTSFSLPFGTLKFDVLPDGRIITLTDDKLYIETASGSQDFKKLGKVQGMQINPYGPAFLKVSTNGKKVAIGDNSGKIGIFDIKTLLGKWYSFSHFDAEWYDDNLLAITHGNFGETSKVSIMDIRSQPNEIKHFTVIDNIGGASAGITFDTKGNLYTGNGYKGAGPSGTGTVKFFPYSVWTKAMQNNTSLNFEKDGVFIIDILSANSLGFDSVGNLYIGGSDQFGDGIDVNFAAIIKKDALLKTIQESIPIDPQNENEVFRIDPDSQNAVSQYDVNSNPKNGDLYLKDGPTVYVCSLISADKLHSNSWKKKPLRCKNSQL